MNSFDIKTKSATHSRLLTPILALLLIGSTWLAACAPNTSGPGTMAAPAAGTAQSTETTGHGGVDSSGGDLILSSVEQVEAATKDLHPKLFTLLSRLGMEIEFLRKLSFEDRFGPDTYSLSRKFLRARVNTHGPNRYAEKGMFDIELKKSGSCIGDNATKHGSATVNSGGRPSICLSMDALRTLSPDSLQIDVLALATHELSHLFGYKEPEAKRLQEMILKNKAVLWPPADTIQTYISNIRDIRDLTGDINIAATKKNYDRVCELQSKLMTAIIQATRTQREQKSVLLSSAVDDNLRNLGILTGLLEMACAKKDADLEKNIGGVQLGLFESSSTALGFAEYLANPQKGIPKLPTFHAMSLALWQESTAVALANKKSATSTLDFTDIKCRATLYNDGKPSFAISGTPAAGRAFHQSEEGSVGVVDYAINDQSPLKLRKVKGQRGISMAYLSKSARILSFKGGMLTNAGDTKFPALVVNFVPEVQNDVQFVVRESDSMTLLFRCGVVKNVTPISLQFLDLTTMQKTVASDGGEDVSETPTPETERDSSEDDFSVPTTVQLTIQLNAEGAKGKRGGPSKRVIVSTLRYDGLLKLKGEAETCMISPDLIEKKGLKPLEFAQSVRDGKVKSITCHMNGDVMPDLRFSTAPWAFDFEYQ